MLMVLSQADLIPEDVMLLDCWVCIYIWIGQNCNVAERKEAPVMAQVFIDFHYQYVTYYFVMIIEYFSFVASVVMLRYFYVFVIPENDMLLLAFYLLFYDNFQVDEFCITRKMLSEDNFNKLSSAIVTIYVPIFSVP